MVTMEWGLLVVLVLVRSTWADSTQDVSHTCKLVTQESLDLDEIKGKWYVVEVLDHKRDKTRPKGAEPIQVVVDSCPIIKINLNENKDQLRLLWSEEAGDLEYTFRFGERGTWNSSEFQNGTLTQKVYNQFTGSIHIMKAVSNHMVLTFCSTGTNGLLYSVLMSREHILQPTSIERVHKLLGRRNLGLVTIRETCAKGGATSTTTSVSLLVLGLCWLVSSRLL